MGQETARLIEHILESLITRSQPQVRPWHFTSKYFDLCVYLNPLKQLSPQQMCCKTTYSSVPDIRNLIRFAGLFPEDKCLQALQPGTPSPHLVTSIPRLSQFFRPYRKLAHMAIMLHVYIDVFLDDLGTFFTKLSHPCLEKLVIRVSIHVNIFLLQRFRT